MDICHTIMDAMSHLKLPAVTEKIFKDECPFYFESPEQKAGVYICVNHLIAVGPSMLRKYSLESGCQVYLQYQIKREFKPIDPEVDSKPTRLAYGLPGGFMSHQDRYTVKEFWSLVVLPNEDGLVLPNPPEGTSPADCSHLEVIGIPAPLASVLNAIQRTESALLAEERAKEVAAWELENVRPTSAFAIELSQLNNGVRVPPKGWTCSVCGLKENLWLNLTDGSIHCGRRFWDGSGGNNHAVEHYQQTGYPLAVKLGTITPQGAEVFSYAEDDMVTDPLLEQHLAHFGIDIMRMEKTDKTLAELEVAANEKLGEWRTLQESDRQLHPRYGPGLTGLHNLGNTCYMNTILQVLFAIPQYRRIYANRMPFWIDKALSSFKTSGLSSSLLEDIGLQFAKLGHGLCSGLHSWRYPENLDNLSEGPVPILPGIRPLLFRRLMGKHNANFATHQQQDACEFLCFLLDLLDSKTMSAENHSSNVYTTHDETSLPTYPSSCLRLLIEDRLECGSTHQVRYTTHDEYVLSVPIPLESMTNKSEYDAYERRKDAETKGISVADEAPVRPRIPFEACLSAWAATEKVDGFISPSTGAETFAMRSSRLLNFPDYLCVQLAKYTVGSDWLPRKLDVEVEFGHIDGSSNCLIDLSCLRSTGGLQPGEVPMPDAPSKNARPAFPQADPEIVAELSSMGFSTIACENACIKTNNVGLEAATNWIMEHLDDPMLNTPLVQSANEITSTRPFSSTIDSPNEGLIEQLTAIGLTRKQAIEALRHTNNNLECAANWAFSNMDTLLTSDEAVDSEVIVSTESATVHPSMNSPPSKDKFTDGLPRYELCAFISHMGKSTTHGHYVAHIKRSSLAKCIPSENSPLVTQSLQHCGETDDEWIIFNDEKVAKSESPPYRLAYIYIFRRLDCPLD